MNFFDQRGCHFISGSVLFGDPIFGKTANQNVNISNINNGYWYIDAQFLSDKTNKNVKSRIVLQFSEYKTTARLALAGEHLTCSVSGYLGIFDEMRFQAGWTNRCQRWFEYCQYSIGNETAWSVITGGIVFRVDGHAEESLCRSYLDKLGHIAKLEIWF